MKPKFIAAALIVLAASPGLAQETIEEKAMLCAACHGENGVPATPEVPIIWGQHAGYLYIQLKDFKSKSRASEIMHPIAAELEKADMLALALYFEGKPWPATGYRSEDADVNKGETIASAGMCASCHLGTFFGDSVIPRVAGQTQVYLERILIAFKTRERNNNADKSNLMGTFADEDLKTMSRYLAGL
ncbi:MAG: c-type cytochrome [Hyphomicrobiales bacterium]